MIGDEIELSVVSITEGKVVLGIEAPRSIPIVRKELLSESLRDTPSEPDAAE